MKFDVDPKIFSFFPGMHLVVAVPETLTNSDSEGLVSAYWNQAWLAAGNLDLPNAQSHPHVRQFREQFQGIGVSHKKFPTSIEALLRRALKGGDRFSINPLVDFYNAISLNHVVAAGAFDLDPLEGDIELRLTCEGDQFTALDQDEAIMVDPGEVAYASGSTILTRHFMWRQARTGLVHQDSSRIFLVSEVPAVAGKECAIRIEKEFQKGLQDFFGVPSQTFLLDSQRTQIEF